ncbi:MAG: glycosyltransferase family 4 protein [Anaerolineae bacterium]|nr:glycosyltransferase family 4 protein [Anaerolineae bacterium]
MVLGIDASRAVTTERTGTEAYSLYLIRALIEPAAAAGIKLRLYFNQPTPPGLFAAAPHIEQVIIPLPRLWTHLRLAQELHRRPPDIFFTPAHVIPLTYRGRALATIHDLGYHYFPQAHPLSQRLYLHWSTQHNARRASHILADSQATKNDLIHVYKTTPEKVTVVYPALPSGSEQLAVSREQLLAHSPTRKLANSPYFLYLGTLQPRKNLVRLVDAFVQSGVSHHLVLAGRVGWLAQELLAFIKQQPVSVQGRIHLPGYVSEAEKADLLRGAAALLYPSLYEGFGFPILEAQAAGIPVLCANSSSLPEAAGDGALLVDPLDTAGMAAAIYRLANEAPLCQDLVERGYANVKRFSWEDAAAKIIAILQQRLLLV